MGTLNRYGQSKLANILFSSELAKRYPQFKVVAVHPGIVDTNLSNTMVQHSILLRAMMKVVKPTIEVSVTEGVKNQLWACTADKIASGAYYELVGVAGKESRYAKDPELAKGLWDWTEKELAQFDVSPPCAGEHN